MSGRGRAADWESPVPPASFRQTSRWQVSGGQRAICAARPPTLSQGLHESCAQRRGCPSASSVLGAERPPRLRAGPGAVTGLWALGRVPAGLRGGGWTVGLPTPHPSLCPPEAALSLTSQVRPACPWKAA